MSDVDILLEGAWHLAENTVDCIRMARTAQLMIAGYDFDVANLIAEKEKSNRWADVLNCDPQQAILKQLDFDSDKKTSTWSMTVNKPSYYILGGDLFLDF